MKVGKAVKKKVKKRAAGIEQSGSRQSVKKVLRKGGSLNKGAAGAAGEGSAGGQVIDEYTFKSAEIPVRVTVKRMREEYVPIYDLNISVISKATQLILERIREEIIKAVNLGMIELRDLKRRGVVEEKFQTTIQSLIEKYFPDANDNERTFMTTYLIQRSLGMGNLEILNDDRFLEEIVINSSTEPVWVYHKKHGWLKTNVLIDKENQIKHYATTIGRKVGRQLSVLEPLLDAHLAEGDRVNATLFPISTDGNTMTIRRFSRDPWTITHFLESKTISANAAALIWLGIQYELSAIIAGGTASGKTSTLNVLANFFPPNQRIISIEDTRELQLPKFLHWVPLSTRLPNVEGKGEISMGDLLVNSLRMRPDRILAGEVRRKREAETLFEAIHTGHSCYATFHANDAHETINRFTNPPIEVPKTMMPAISMIINQFRNRRTGLRRTFQVAEILPDCTANVLMQYDPKRDVITTKNKSRSLFQTLQLFTGNSPAEINRDIAEKEVILKYLVKQQLKGVNSVGKFIAEYYTNKENVLKYVRSNKQFIKPEARKAPQESGAATAEETEGAIPELKKGSGESGGKK
ncbi:type II/IV secretion system ATPase subunit [Candidatus Woesearchaeota archaeon]|nr:type II/IV secretion system ATPase subunit [Candidatus Woesearchaeota archaeon]